MPYLPRNRDRYSRIATAPPHRQAAATRVTPTRMEQQEVVPSERARSLIGLLNHACKVVRSGRSFLRHMIDLLHSTSHPPRGKTPIRLNAAFRADLAWLVEFVHSWNGVSFLPHPQYLPQMQMASDASGSWGCGAWHQTAWFQVEWDSRSISLTIAEKELIPVVLACAAWGRKWRGHNILCLCDNQVVVACLRSRTSKTKGLMHLLRCLVFIEAKFNFFVSSEYIDTLCQPPS